MERAALVAAVLAVAGCATQQPFSYVTGNRFHRAELNSYSMIILDVDGRSDISSSIQVSPGRRVLTVQAPPGRGFSYGDMRTFVLDVKPCTRYYLKAVKKNPIEQDFEPMIDYEEPIGGCRATM